MPPDVATDSTFDLLARALEQRRRAGSPPVTILSCDNLPGNGDAARRALLGAADAVAAGLADVDRVALQLPELDGRPHHAGDDRRRPRRPARTGRHRRPLAGRRRTVPPVGAGGRLRGGPAGMGSTSASLFTDDVHAWELYKLRILNAGHSCMAYLCALGRDHVRRRGDGDSRGARLRRADCSYEEAVPALAADPRLPAATSTRRRSSSASPTPACATRSPGCASTAPPSSRRSSSRRSSTTSRPADRSVMPPSPSPGGRATWRPSRSTSSRRTRHGELSRRLARDALDEPVRFLDLDAVFTAALRDSERFRTRVRRRSRGAGRRAGPIAAMAALGGVG